MDASDRTPEETLREHERFVRALSLRLLRNADDADDNTQDTCLAALERPPRHAANLRGWLGVVARRLALRKRRAAARRLAREAGLTPPEARPPVEDVAARLEIQREVLDLVRALPEPYRTAIGLRYLHGLSAREIAEVRDVPLETVKTHLARALQRLREGLSRGHAGRRGGWRCALLPLVLPPTFPLPAGPAGSALSNAVGEVVMKKVVVAVAVLLLLAAGFVVLRSLSSPDVSAERESARAEDADGDVGSPRLGGTGAPPRETAPTDGYEGEVPEITVVTQASGGSSGGSPVGWGASLGGSKASPFHTAEPTDDPVRSALRVLTTASDPAATATLRLERSQGRETTVLAERQLTPGGTITVPGLEPGCVTVRLEVAGLLRSLYPVLVPGRVTELEVALPAGADVSGIVRHVTRGPLAGVTLRLEREDRPWYDRIDTETDASGAYALHDVPPGTWAVCVQGGAAGSMLRPRAALTVPGTDPVVQDLLVGRVALEGTVRDASTGEPLAFAEVELGGRRSVRVRTDVKGRYAISDVVPGAYALFVVRSGYALAELSVVLEAETPTTLDVALDAAAPLHLRLRDGDGLPVSGSVQMEVSGLGGVDVSTPTVGLLSDGEGLAHCMLLRPGEYDLVVQAEGCERKAIRATLPPEGCTLEVVVERGAGTGVVSLTGTIRDGKTGEPIPGVQIRATRADGLAVTDEAGGYVLRDLAGEVCDLILTHHGHGYTVLRDVALRPGETRLLDIDLPPAVTLRAYLEQADGRPVTGTVMLSVRPAPGTEGTRFTWGVTPDAEGLVISRKIVPGRYTIAFEREDQGRATLDVVLSEGVNVVRARLE